MVTHAMLKKRCVKAREKGEYLQAAGEGKKTSELPQIDVREEHNSTYNSVQPHPYHNNMVVLYVQVRNKVKQDPTQNHITLYSSLTCTHIHITHTHRRNTRTPVPQQQRACTMYVRVMYAQQRNAREMYSQNMWASGGAASCTRNVLAEHVGQWRSSVMYA